MIVTITLNPAIDKTIVIESRNSSKVIETFKQAAGKGVNVSNVIKALGHRSIAATILAGENGEFIHADLKKKNIRQLSVTVKGETRVNRKLIVQSTGRVQELNEDGPITKIDQVNQLLEVILEESNSKDIIILSGSVPLGLPLTIYKDLVEKLNKEGYTCILDTSDKLLQEGIKAKPHTIKPNMEEISMYAGKELETIDEAMPYIEEILELGVKEVILTMGSNGSLYVSKEESIQVLPLDIKVVNTIGAGDSFLAGYAIALEKGMSVEERMIYANAVATCSVMSVKTVASNFDQVEAFVNQTKIKR